MKTIYCISGLGADERAFSKLTIAGYNLKVIPWLEPGKTETIENYARRMRATIETENPFLMGLSFGGMICIEIAKQIHVEKIIMISSIKTSGELPFWLKTVARLRLDKFFPLRTNKLIEPIQNKMLGITDAEDKKMVANYRRNANQKYIKWAVNQAINWKNDWQPPEIYHIHGESDNLFPIKNIKADFTIKNAGHFMIMNRAVEVSDIINHILNKK